MDHIQFINVSFEFTQQHSVINSINLVIESGSFTGLVGPNGSGKTTLARLINGNILPTTGSVLVNGWLTSEASLESRRLVSLIQADAENQIITSTVYDEVAFGLFASGIKQSEIRVKAESALKQFDLLKYRNVHPFFLSVGEQFRLLVAAAVVRKPNYLILDEVLSMLDSPTRHQFISLIMELKDNLNIGIILITHRLEDLNKVDKVLVMDKGSLVSEISGKDLYGQPEFFDQWGIQIPLSYQVNSRLHGIQKRLVQDHLNFHS